MRLGMTLFQLTMVNGGRGAGGEANRARSYHATPQRREVEARDDIEAETRDEGEAEEDGEGPAGDGTAGGGSLGLFPAEERPEIGVPVPVPRPSPPYPSGGREMVGVPAVVVLLPARHQGRRRVPVVDPSPSFHRRRRRPGARRTRVPQLRHPFPSSAPAPTPPPPGSAGATALKSGYLPPRRTRKRGERRGEGGWSSSKYSFPTLCTFLIAPMSPSSPPRQK